jgi:hypothetical protein
MEESDHRHRRLLRTRSYRPRCRRAAEQRDELASLAVGTYVSSHAPRPDPYVRL